MDLVMERSQDTKPQNLYQPGDLVLFQYPRDKPLPHKLGAPYSGPYEVLSQYKNDVSCKHIVLGTHRVFYVETLKMFFGSYEDAYALALQDADQFVVAHFIAYRGDPLTRTTVEFFVEFEDGDKKWLPWSNDLFNSVPYETYCSSVSALFPLLYRLDKAKSIITELNRTPITAVAPGDKVLVDLRSYGATWYQNLGLPNCDFITYVIEYVYSKWSGAKHFKIEAKCDVFNETFIVDHLFVKQYGSNKVFLENSMVLIDVLFVQKYPQVLS